MRILTTTMCYPTAECPDQGVFVQRRCLALAQLAEVSLRVVSPQPWFPVLRPQRTDASCGPLPASYPRMASIPVLGWATDGVAFARTLECEIVDEMSRGRRPDVIDAHFEYPDGVGACLAGRRLSIPVVVTIRGKIVSLSRKTLRRMQIAWTLRNVTARIAVSRSLADWARRIGGSDLRVEVIPNGIDRAVFHRVERRHAQQSLRWDPAARYILAVGHQQFVKGFDRILESVPAIRQACPDALFVLVGSERGERWFRARLRQLAASCNRECEPGMPCVQLLPPAPAHTLNLMYNAADLLVNASRSEGWCNAIGEALACGTPVVATDVGGNREQIANDTLGRLVPEANVSVFAEAVVEALEHPWDREVIAAIGSARSWNDTARQVHAILSEAALQSGCSQQTTAIIEARRAFDFCQGL